jgi:ankyrin repeat protein
MNRTPPLIHAVKNNLFDIYKILIANGADVNLTNLNGFTPLMYASDIEIVKDLIKHGAYVNAKSTYRETALTLKYESENIELIKCLIENGADVNIKDYEGKSLLLKAFKYDNIELVTYLIEQTDVVIPTEEEIKYSFDRQADRDRVLSEIKRIIEHKYIDVIDRMIHNEYAEGDINNENLIGIIYDLHDMNYFSKVSDYLIR